MKIALRIVVIMFMLELYKNECDNELDLNLSNLQIQPNDDDINNPFYTVSADLNMVEKVKEEDFTTFTQKSSVSIKNLQIPKRSESFFFEIQWIKLAYISVDEFNDEEILEIKQFQTENGLVGDYDDVNNKFTIPDQKCVEKSSYSNGTPFLEYTKNEFMLVIPIFHKKDSPNIRKINDELLEKKLIEKKEKMEEEITRRIEAERARKRENIQKMKQRVRDRYKSEDSRAQKIGDLRLRIEEIQNLKRERENSVDISKSRLEFV